jgi:hypothetical protein
MTYLWISFCIFSGFVFYSILNGLAGDFGGPNRRSDLETMTRQFPGVDTTMLSLLPDVSIFLKILEEIARDSPVISKILELRDQLLEEFEL